MVKGSFQMQDALHYRVSPISPSPGRKMRAGSAAARSARLRLAGGRGHDAESLRGPYNFDVQS
jgi:hypothetical protein